MGDIEEKEKEILEKSKKQLDGEPSLQFVQCLIRVTVEQILEYCLERCNHHKKMKDYKEELSKRIEGIHKKNMEVVDFNLKKLFL